MSLIYFNSFLSFVIIFIHSITCMDSDILLTPSLPNAVKDSGTGFSQFLNLWEFSLRSDNKATHRDDAEPKTLLLPGDASMAQLVPQDASHPLFLGESKYAKMRQEFILDHLVLDAIPVEGTDESIISAVTLSGKEILIQKDAEGKVTVNDIPVRKALSFADTYYVYVLKTPLFNQTFKVRKAFEELHRLKSDDPVGPPLDIPQQPFPDFSPMGPSVIRAPAPPPGVAEPPAPPIHSADPHLEPN